MCGRYALILRPSQVRRLLEDDNMPVWDAPDDSVDDDGGAGGVGSQQQQQQQQQTPRQSYNFAPGYNGLVYRADVPDYGAGPHRERGDDSKNARKKTAAASQQAEAKQKEHEGTDEVHYKLQAMKWGLIPFWTKRNPDYPTVLKTINCRDDSLAAGGGMWNTMKARKRCIVLAQGFYEWLKVGPKERVPYYIKRKDGKLLCLAGLWDCVQYEGDEEKTYTYTIITTDSNKQLKFLHDRMPVILEPGSEALRTWLDPGRHEWSKELQSLLRPFNGELDVYAVTKDVNKVGGSSPSYVIPVASKENKSNIANFFASAATSNKEAGASSSSATAATNLETDEGTRPSESSDTKDAAVKHQEGVKRPAELGPLNTDEQPPPKKQAVESSSSPNKKSSSRLISDRTISATKNAAKSPSKSKAKQSAGMQKITKFFGK